MGGLRCWSVTKYEKIIKPQNDNLSATMKLYSKLWGSLHARNKGRMRRQNYIGRQEEKYNITWFLNPSK